VRYLSTTAFNGRRLRHATAWQSGAAAGYLEQLLSLAVLAAAGATQQRWMRPNTSRHRSLRVPFGLQPPIRAVYMPMKPLLVTRACGNGRSTHSFSQGVQRPVARRRGMAASLSIRRPRTFHGCRRGQLASWPRTAGERRQMSQIFSTAPTSGRATHLRAQVHAPFMCIVAAAATEGPVWPSGAV